MNSFLPEFYKTKFNKQCKNNKQFVKEFHGTGRELYHLKQQIDEIDNQIKSMMNKENPAAAGAVLDEDHNLIPGDNIRINNNIQKAIQIIVSLSVIVNKIKTFDSKHFSSNGKLKSGEEATHKFFENQLGEVALLHKTVKEINNFKQNYKKSALNCLRVHAKSQKVENVNRNKQEEG